MTSLAAQSRSVLWNLGDVWPFMLSCLFQWDLVSHQTAPYMREFFAIQEFKRHQHVQSGAGTSSPNESCPQVKRDIMNCDFNMNIHNKRFTRGSSLTVAVFVEKALAPAPALFGI
ncbi:hypothetical protein DPMN_138050 [Dreissena polymorpha]|uniref:Uncharacterized protein n=1 Tax=Dreissena polymorpha TaxID=45954 RepID=A0A9D4JGX7_DREPO|nr:hypothetical protein DPMN_138050 [Dreissena polymorpha]